MSQNGTNRIFGLDILRSLAIVIVVIAHCNPVFDLFFTGPSFIPLPDGVDLFFVLSGFLVGKILVKTGQDHKTLTFWIILKFLKRRWFRTLPNYFLFLLLNILLVSLGLIKGQLNALVAAYFFFLQNFFKPIDFLFWESWSLSVEEWFYILFPLVALIVLKISRLNLKAVFLVSTLLFILGPLLYRWGSLPLHSDWDLYFRKLVVTRLDAIGWGLAGAYIYSYYNAYWIKLRLPLFLTGLVILLSLLSVDLTRFPVFYKTIYFSVSSISILFLLPMLEGIKTEKIPFRPFMFTSKISYSMYLVHAPLLQLMAGSFPEKSLLGNTAAYFLFWAVLFILSLIVYRFFEKPFTDLRDKPVKEGSSFYKTERS